MQNQDIIYKLSRALYHFLIEKGVSENTAINLNLIVNIIALTLLIILIDWFLRRIIIKAFQLFSNKTKTTFDDFLVRGNFPKYTAHIIPFIVVKTVIPYLLSDFPKTAGFLLNVADIYFVFLVIWIARSFVRSTRDYLKNKDSFKDKPIDSYAQIVMILIWFLGIVFIFSDFTGKSIITFLTTVGAASAILLLIFRDTILGFVASIQVSINDIVRIGDWITQDKYGADGDVIEINLTTVKVKNFDNTITTIPTYSLISDSFKNWRGMQESDGRRIKRALIIASGSIRFLTIEDMERLKKIQLIKPYIEQRQKDIDTYNKKHKIDKTLPINGRNQTNLGVFRKYIDIYIKNHSAINKDMVIVVRHLAPTPQGIPLEIYAFSNDRYWENYEYIIADIFEHLLASASYFDLQFFELPSGNDFKTLKKP